MNSNGSFLIICISLCMGLLIPAHAADPNIIFKPYNAQYKVKRGSDEVGKAFFSLRPMGKDCYQYRGHADPEGIAAILVPETTSISRFCLVNGRIQPRVYKTWEGAPDDEAELDEDLLSPDDDDGLGEPDDDNYILTFDWAQEAARTNRLAPRKVPVGAVDHQSMHQALRYWVAQHNGQPKNTLKLDVVEDNKTKTYEFKVVGRENVSSKAGSWDAVRVDRIDSPKKSIRFWLAPTLNYMPVKVQRVKKDRPDITMTLRAM